ncbi:unnamed protein product [Polarella glacialis]|uniref:Uncharacterized protein n=1 Tax=Polarella glacialis TaxID=89957 RepID=A0A813KS51_POLGL|nr:unnamed protein product [Polarella glacialis]
MGEEGQWRLLNPLSIRFSQPRVAPRFKDGHSVAEARESTVAVLLQGRKDPDGFCKPPPYDLLLIPAFPAIRVVPFEPKLRASDGVAQRDPAGNSVRGKRAWFALDNRRLLALQRVAITKLPQLCCVAVRCFETPGGPGARTQSSGQSLERELRKFRTVTEGWAVDVGEREGSCHLWSWREAIAGVAGKDPCLLYVEPISSEELWDAHRWAPEAVSAGDELQRQVQDKEASSEEEVILFRGPKSRTFSKDQHTPCETVASDGTVAS